MTQAPGNSLEPVLLAVMDTGQAYSRVGADDPLRTPWHGCLSARAGREERSHCVGEEHSLVQGLSFYQRHQGAAEGVTGGGIHGVDAESVDVLEGVTRNQQGAPRAPRLIMAAPTPSLMVVRLMTRSPPVGSVLQKLRKRYHTQS